MRLGGCLVLDLFCTGRAGSFSAVLRLPLAVLVTSLTIIIIGAVAGRSGPVYAASSECPPYVGELELQHMPGRPAVHIIGRARMVVLRPLLGMPEQIGRLWGQMALYVSPSLLYRQML